jgi:hypothetical protein
MTLFWTSNLSADPFGQCGSLFGEDSRRERGIQGPRWPISGSPILWSPTGDGFLVQRGTVIDLFQREVDSWKLRQSYQVRDLLNLSFRVGATPEIDISWSPRGDAFALVGEVSTQSGVSWSVAKVSFKEFGEIERRTFALPKSFQMDNERNQRERERFGTRLQWSPQLGREREGQSYLMLKAFVANKKKWWQRHLNLPLQSWGIVLMISSNALHLDGVVGSVSYPGWDIVDVFTSSQVPHRVMAILKHPQYEDKRVELWDLPRSQRLLEGSAWDPKLPEYFPGERISIWNRQRVGYSFPNEQANGPVLLEASPDGAYHIKRSPVPGWGGKTLWGLDIIRVIRETVNEDQPFRQIHLASLANEFPAPQLTYFWLRNGEELLVREEQGRLFIWDQKRRDLSMTLAETILLQGSYLLTINKARSGQREIQVYGLNPWTFRGRLRIEAGDRVLGVTMDESILVANLEVLTGGTLSFREISFRSSLDAP